LRNTADLAYLNVNVKPPVAHHQASTYFTRLAGLVVYVQGW
jgi:hypothetical protein